MELKCNECHAIMYCRLLFDVELYIFKMKTEEESKRREREKESQCERDRERTDRCSSMKFQIAFSSLHIQRKNNDI